MAPKISPQSLPPTPAKNLNRGDENLACYTFAKSQDAKMQDFIAKISANQMKNQ